MCTCVGQVVSELGPPAEATASPRGDPANDTSVEGAAPAVSESGAHACKPEAPPSPLQAARSQLPAPRSVRSRGLWPPGAWWGNPPAPGLPTPRSPQRSGAQGGNGPGAAEGPGRRAIARSRPGIGIPLSLSVCASYMICYTYAT